MRQLSLLVIMLLTACAPEAKAPEAQSEGWRPSPVEDALEPSAVVEVAPADAWRTIDPQNLLLIDLADGKRVVVELAPEFAPVHAANIRALARGGWWTNASVYRVQENYVVQWGVNESDKPLPAGVVKAPPAEYVRDLKGLTVRPLGYPDSYAPSVGHVAGWPVAYDSQSGKAWLAHCYGMVGAGRDLSPDTGTGGELYAVIGHAPRHLDRNIALVGRVIDGLDAMTAHQRGTEALGFIKEKADQIPIARVTLAADLPEAARPVYQAMNTDSENFSQFVTGRANRGGDFFDIPAGGVDLCNALVPTRRVR